VEPCDVLITETTFADPLYAHPPEQDELSKLEAYEKTNIVIGAYNLGKSQRITKLLTDRFPHRRVMVHPEATGFHKIYEQMGIKLGQLAAIFLPIVPPDHRKYTYCSTQGFINILSRSRSHHSFCYRLEEVAFPCTFQFSFE
jgi:putative mRNA 3-end processing factor